MMFKIVLTRPGNCSWRCI